MKWTTVSKINQYNGKSLNPASYPDELFEMYSVPSYDSNYPEIVKGETVGASKQTVEAGDVLLCKINPRINRVWCVEKFTEHRLIASSEWIVVRSTSYIPQYLRYYFSSAKFRELLNLQVAGIGGSLTRAQPKQVATYPVPIATLDEQQIIVNELSEIDSLISNRSKTLSLLDGIVKSRFIEMFGDPVANPHGWEKVPLSELAEIKIGPFGTLLHKEDYIIGGHALVNPSHIIDGTIVTDEKLTISNDKYRELAAYHLFENDVVMGRRGEMGRCAVVQTKGLLCGTGSMIIRSNGDVRADFLQKIISFPSFKKTIEDMAVGQTMPNLNVPIVSRLEIIKPPTDVQDAYYDFVALADKSKFAVQQSIDTLQTLKTKLMQDYFG